MSAALYFMILECYFNKLLSTPRLVKDNNGFGNDETVEFNTANIVEPPGVLAALKSLSPTGTVTVGFVGYPNVGKSSTINRFLENRRLQVQMQALF